MQRERVRENRRVRSRGNDTNRVGFREPFSNLPFSNLGFALTGTRHSRVLRRNPRELRISQEVLDIFQGLDSLVHHFSFRGSSSSLSTPSAATSSSEISDNMNESLEEVLRALYEQPEEPLEEVSDVREPPEAPIQKDSSEKRVCDLLDNINQLLSLSLHSSQPRRGKDEMSDCLFAIFTEYAISKLKKRIHENITGSK